MRPSMLRHGTGARAEATLALLAMVVILMATATTSVQGMTIGDGKGTTLDATVLILGRYDWARYPGQTGPQITSRCIDMVWRAAKVGSNRIQFVTTHYYLPDAQGGVQSYCYMDETNTCQPFSRDDIQGFQQGMGLCFQAALDAGFTQIALTPHLDCGSGGQWTISTWRNGLVFDPRYRYAGLSYEDLMLLPLARALHAISSDPRLGHVYFSLQGEMGATVMRYPHQYSALVDVIRSTVTDGSSTSSTTTPVSAVQAIPSSGTAGSVVRAGNTQAGSTQRGSVLGSLVRSWFGVQTSQAQAGTSVGANTTSASVKAPAVTGPSIPQSKTAASSSSSSSSSGSSTSAVPGSDMGAGTAPALQAQGGGVAESEGGGASHLGDDGHTVRAQAGAPDGGAVLPDFGSTRQGDTIHAPEVDMGLTFNFDYSDGSQAMTTTAAGRLAVGVFGWAFGFRPGFGAPNFESSQVAALFARLDFVGVSAWAPLNGGADFEPEELQNSAFNVFDAFSSVGVDLKGIMQKTGAELHYVEFGIGGGMNQGGGIKARTPAQATVAPYWGIQGAYSPSNDPWADPTMASFRRAFYNRTLKWLAKGGGPTYGVEACYVWDKASWDVLGIYPESTTPQGSYGDSSIIAATAAHNRAVLSAGGGGGKRKV